MIEVQAKKGLRRGAKLWSALIALARPIHCGELDYGILAIASDSSPIIKEKLAADLVRLGQGRTDRLSSIGEEFHTLLNEENLCSVEVCRNLRIRVIDTLISNNRDINAARDICRTICGQEADASAAFDILGHRALLLIENRGRWTLRDLVRLLKSRGIKLGGDGSPAALLDRYSQWICDTHNDFTIIGSARRIPIQHLLPMKLEHREFEQPEAADAFSALERYQKVHQRETIGNTFDSLWTARFKRQAVVVAGPGLGKSTLLRALAYQYSLDGFMVLSAPLKLIAKGILDGKTFTDMLVRKSFDGSGISVADQINDKRFHWVILLDALDECGEDHRMVADGIRAIASGHPEARIVVTTRPIGYHTTALKDWVHYTLLPPIAEEATENVETLLKLIVPQDLRRDALLKLPPRFGRHNAPTNGFAISPQLLGMSAVLIMRKRALPSARVKLYAELIRLFEESEIQARASDGGDLTDIAVQVLDLAGWHLLTKPALTFNELIEFIGTDMGLLLGTSLLLAKRYARDALRHWERLGLVETIHHGDTRLTAFIHKSFCEFVAGRHLSQQALPVVSEALNHQELHEVFTFGVGLGLAEKLIDIYLGRYAQGESDQLLLALALLSKPETIVAEYRAKAVLNLSFKAIDEGAVHTYAIGLALTDIHGQMGAFVSAEAAQRLHSSDPAVKLVAWALFSRSMMVDINTASVLEELILAVPAQISAPLFAEPKQERHDLELLRRLASNFLKACPDGKARDFALLLQDRVFSNFGFISDIDAHLESRGIRPISKFRDRLPSGADPVSVAVIEPGFQDAGMRATVAVAKAFVTGDHRFDLIAAGQRSFPQLSGFLRASGFMNMPASDVYQWDKPYEDAFATSTLRFTASLLPLDMQTLQRESGELINLYLSGESSIFTILPDVDIQELPPVTGMKPPFDLDDVKQALLHPSEWLCRLATEICASFPMSGPELQELLRISDGHSLRAVLRLVAVHHPDRLTDMAWHRLARWSTGDVSGILHVFIARKVKPFPDLLDITFSCLCNNGKDTGLAAAELLGKWLDQGVVLDADKVETAVKHWGGREAAKPFSSLHSPLHSIIGLLDRILAA